MVSAPGEHTDMGLRGAPTTRDPRPLRVMRSRMMPENSGCTRLMWHQPEGSDTSVSTSVFPLIRDKPPPPRTADLLDDAVDGGCCTTARAGAARCSTASSKIVVSIVLIPRSARTGALTSGRSVFPINARESQHFFHATPPSPFYGNNTRVPSFWADLL